MISGGKKAEAIRNDAAIRAAEMEARVNADRIEVDAALRQAKLKFKELNGKHEYKGKDPSGTTFKVDDKGIEFRKFVPTAGVNHSLFPSKPQIASKKKNTGDTARVWHMADSLTGQVTAETAQMAAMVIKNRRG